MCLPGIDVLGKLNPTHLGPIFVLVILDKSNLEPLNEGLDVLENTKFQILKAV